MVRILLIYVILSLTLSAQSDQIFRVADSLFISENYFDAITEYKRVNFYDSGKMFAYESNYRIGLAYKAGGFFENAIEYFGASLKNSDTDERKFSSFVEMIRCNILRGTPENGISMINRAIENGDFTNLTEDLYYWRGWALLFSDRWKEASASFSRIDVDHPLKKYASDIHNKKYDVTFAKLISYILPGSGQVYAGEYVSGIMSLGWTVLWGYVTVDAFASERVFDGFAVGNLLWFRFYRGNVQNAEKFALERNNEIYREALLYLQNNFEGIKP